MGGLSLLVAHTLTRTVRCSFLLAPSRGAESPLTWKSPSAAAGLPTSDPPFPFGASLTPLGVWGSLALGPSPPCEAPLGEDGDGRARNPRPCGEEKWLLGAGLGRHGQTPGPFSCLEHSRACQLLPQPGPHRTLKPGVCLEKPLHPHSPFLEIAVVGREAGSLAATEEG